MKKILKIFLICCICMVLAVLFFALMFPPAEWYIVTDVASYGIFDGYGNNDRANELFSAIFPAQIEDCFQDVTYSYKATNIDTYDFEIYLEFVMEDTDKFLKYMNEIAPRRNGHLLRMMNPILSTYMRIGTR